MTNEMVIDRYIFQPINANMYVLIDGDEALVVDPHPSDQAFDRLWQAHVSKVLILLTHEHFDHTSGVNWLRMHFECILLCHESCADSIANAKKNRPMLTLFAMKAMTGLQTFQSYTCKADRTFSGEMLMKWHNHEIKLVSTPGHTPGSCCIELNEQYVFTGDSWLESVPVITRLPGGNIAAYEAFTVPYLQQISDKYLILPGHGDRFHGNFKYGN